MSRLSQLLAAILWAATVGAATGCRRGSAPQDEEPRTGGRTMTAIEPHLTRSLTPALARERLGAPDSEGGSGLIIYKYALEGGDTLALAFPGYAPITYAMRVRPDGSRIDIPLR